MAESKRGLFGKSLAVVLLACLLGVIVYSVPLGPVSTPNSNPNPDSTKQAYAFMWLQENQATDTDYNETTLVVHALEMSFGTNDGLTFTPQNNGTLEELINTIKSWLSNGIYFGGISGFVGGGIKVTMGEPGTDSGYISNFTFWENSTVSATLIGTTVHDMGSYSMIMNPKNWVATSTPGYWPDASKNSTLSPKWSIRSEQLLSYLESNGTATIVFDASFSAHVDYVVTTPNNETQAGQKDLAWSGTMGTITIKYDASGIFEAQYNFGRIALVLLVLNPQP